MSPEFVRSHRYFILPFLWSQLYSKLGSKNAEQGYVSQVRLALLNPSLFNGPNEDQNALELEDGLWIASRSDTNFKTVN